MKKNNKRWTRLDQAMMDKGWVRVSIAADKMGIHITTIYRAIETAELQSTKAANVVYVSIKSCIAYLGEEAAKALGLSGGGPAAPEHFLDEVGEAP